MVNILFDIGIIIIAATMLSYVAKFLKQPLLIAYVIAGVIIGPVGLGLIVGGEQINLLAELGIAFLLFTIGLEIDFKKLKHVGMAVLGGGILQIIITFGIGFLLSMLMGMSSMMGIYVGMLIAFSSTMIVTKILVDRDEINTLQGRIMVGVLIVQDLVVIVAMPLLANMPGLLSISILSDVLIKGLGLFSLAVVLNRFIFPKVLDYAAHAREILFLTAVSVCFLFIGFSAVLGFSIVIGAFIAGIAMGNFPYNLEIVGETHALMDFFSIIFFTSLGMQFGITTVSTMWPQFLILLAALVLIKPAIMAFIYLVMGYGGRISSMVGLGMGQASEFTFIIAAQGLLLGHLTGNAYSLIISVVITSMVMTPYFVKFRYRIYKGFLWCRNVPGLRRGQEPELLCPALGILILDDLDSWPKQRRDLLGDVRLDLSALGYVQQRRPDLPQVLEVLADHHQGN